MPDAAWVALSLIRNVGGRTMRALVAEFNGDLRAALRAPPAELRRVPGVGEKIAHAIARVDLDATAQALARWQARGVQVVTLHDRAYPPHLRAQDDAPPTLFVLSDAPFSAERVRQPRTLAIIGTRTPSPTARGHALRLSAELSEAGYTVVSGLAHGVDSHAHTGALASPGGRTLAVLGGGVLNIYPPENRDLAQAIRSRGALMCETRPDATVSAPALVARNRVITGLALAVIVIETSATGGAMHAARFARRQGRPLYVIDCHASGNRALIADGAYPIPPDWSDHGWLTS